MPASCSRSPNSSSDFPGIPDGGWKQLSDSVYEVSRPSEGYFDLEVVFLHGFCSKGDGDAYYQTWMKADGSGNWLDTWLTESFPGARILAVSYDSSLVTSFCAGRMDMYLLGESLVQSLVDLAGVGSKCPVVLVGHCLGGMVLKKIVLFAESSANEERSSTSVSRPYQRFLEHLRGAFFLSTPHLGSDVHIQGMVHGGGPLLENLKLLGTESARMNAEFLKLRSRYKWRTFDVFPANQTATTKLLPYLADTADAHVDWESVPQYVSIVEEASGRADTEGFSVIPGVDHFTISRSSASFAHLISFLRKIKEEEEEYGAQLQRSFGLHTKILDLDHRVDNVLKALQLEASEPLRLALVGVDGLGKSTLTKQVVNVIRYQFEYICRVELEGIKRSRRRKQLEGLVAQNLCYPNGRSVGIDEGRRAWFEIRGKKVLIIIDDVDSEEEIRELLTPNWCGDGSRLIITSSRQDWSQLIVHQVPSLSEEASYQLLVTYLDEAVVRCIPQLQQLMSKVVDECDGLPLVLEIMGKYLRNKRDGDIWSGALKRLQTEDSIDGCSEGNVLWKKLHVSFRSLAELEKSIFLDLASFDLFPPDGRQYDLQIFQSAWRAHWDRGVVKVALLNLEERSFLRLEAENHPHNSRHGRLIGPSKSYVRIHKQLRHMGRWISRPEKRSPKECRWISQFHDLEALLLMSEGASNVTFETLFCVSRPKTEVSSICMENKKSICGGSESRFQDIRLPVQWTWMSGLEALRLLRISNIHFMASDRLKFPLKLALLHMENCTRVTWKENWWLPFSRLSSWPLEDDHVQKLGALCVLIFENCSFVQLPQNVHMLQNLEVLQILLRKLHLKDLPALVELPDTFGGLASLEDLIIERCAALKKLPEGFGALSKLRRLSVRSCSELEVLCESFSSLSQLCRLTLDRLPKLKMLPVTMGDLSSLEDVKLDHCDAIRELPESFASLQSLLQLRIVNCNELRGLPKFDQLRSLKSLDIHCCSKCSYSPDFLLHLISAEMIMISNVGYRAYGVDDNEKALPEPLKQISSLCTLNSNDCQKLPVSVELSSQSEELDSHSSARFPGVVDSASCLPCLKCQGSQVHGDMNGAPQFPVQWTSSTSSQVEDYTNSTGVPGFVDNHQIFTS
ncbi:hypothetical protein R1sor_022038 [Riccia sorocarpa]|uniref:NB-ARC domain-containing protein n=1 Tax=Riccia sorocarpa TaxID=122646 RepID=A0ABD3GIP5_9MARC